MKSITCAAIATALILTLPACRQQEGAGGNDAALSEAAGDLSALSGTWKADLASLKFEQKPDEFSLKDGTYSCGTCIPPLTAAADGQYHPVADRPYYDSMSIRAVDDKTVEFRRRKGGKDVSNNVMTVSADGNVLTNKFHDATVEGSPIDGVQTSTRAGPAPAGAHAISGQWNPDRLGDYTDEALNAVYRIDGNTVSQTVQGVSYTAEIGGPAVALQGDPAGTMVAVAREGANGLRETYSRDGEEVGITTVVPAADGKSVAFTSTDPRDGSKVSWTATKTD